MSDFKIIETQEQLDSIMGERLGKERAKHEKKLEEVTKASSAKIAELEKTIEGMTQKAQEYAKTEETIKELTQKVQSYEAKSVKHRIAADEGLNYKLWDYLKGETEEELRASAKELKSLTPAGRAPRRDPSITPEESETRTALRSMLNQFKQE